MGLLARTFVSVQGNDDRFVKVFRDGRRSGVRPFERRAFPRICGGRSTTLQRAEQADTHDQEAGAENPRTDRGERVQRLILIKVVVVAAGHTTSTEDELGEERPVEPDEREGEGETTEFFRVHLARHLRPPVIQAAEEGDRGASHHDVVEVSDDEVRVMQVQVDADHAQEEAGQTTNREEEEESEAVEHRNVQLDRAAPEGAEPVEHLHAGGNRDEERQEGEDR